MLELTAGKAARHDQVFQAEVAIRPELEGMRGVVTMLVSQEATEAQIVVLTVKATHQVGLISFYYKRLVFSTTIGRGKDIPRQHPLHIGFSSPWAATSAWSTSAGTVASGATGNAESVTGA